MAMAQQLQQAFLHPPLWLPRFLHLFTWDDILLGTPPPYDAPLGPARSFTTTTNK